MKKSFGVLDRIGGMLILRVRVTRYTAEWYREAAKEYSVSFTEKETCHNKTIFEIICKADALPKLHLAVLYAKREQLSVKIEDLERSCR